MKLNCIVCLFDLVLGLFRIVLHETQKELNGYPYRRTLVDQIYQSVHTFYGQKLHSDDTITYYTQYPIIRNGLIRNSTEFLEKFKKRALGRSNLRNAPKNLRNAQCSDFQS